MDEILDFFNAKEPLVKKTVFGGTSSVCKVQTSSTASPLIQNDDKFANDTKYAESYATENDRLLIEVQITLTDTYNKFSIGTHYSYYRNTEITKVQPSKNFAIKVSHFTENTISSADHINFPY